MMGVVAAALLATLGVVALRGGSPTMGFLYTDLDPANAQAIADKLKAQNVAYQLSADGTSVMAPQERLAELRMGMAGQKLGGKIGYDVLDSEAPFGLSASHDKLNETRAIEGELARSIETLDSVTGARVHIVMPERDMFAATARKATAAVTVKTKGRLPAEAVQAMRYLVASSVPELAPESVSVIDQTGALLARAGEAGGASASDADDRQTAVEAKLREQIESLLEPIVGRGKVRAEVSAQIDRDQTREELNVFDPDKQVIAQQVSVESNDQNSQNGASGQAASISAQLPGTAPATGAGSGESSTGARKETSEETRYDNSSTHSVILRAPGKVNRLTVAVMVDGGKGGMPVPQIQRLQRLVENAVGADSRRGDSVIVENIAFAVDPALADAKPGLFSTLPMGQVIGLLKLVLIAVVGIVVLRMLRGKPPPPEPAMMAGAPLAIGNSPEMLALADQAARGDENAIRQIEAMKEDPQLDHEIALAQVDGRIKLSALRRIGDAVSSSPPEAAAVIRQWMNA